MSASTNPDDHTAASASSGGVPQLRTILLTDLADSTALVERLGDGTAAELFRAHDGLVLQLQQTWRGRLIDRSDGMLLLFERPIDGLGFALDYHRGLEEIGASYGVHPKARAGLHVGEVLIWRNSDEAVQVGAKSVEVEGLAKPMAARLMTMARPGQTLLSAVAEPLAHRAARELGERGQHLLWKPHGRWRFKGVPQTQEIFEVGEPGFASLRPPHNSKKAWRDIPLWRRPAALVAQFALVLALAGAAWFASRPLPALAFHERDWVVLADLRNLTGQSLLDDSLEQAFRISLEQSRHVNVLSDLKTRDTLARMQREPGTRLDRAIASEIAIRDGARAVILPTVAEVGGRVRISAEVIDPHNQTTVYAEYADGKGTASALASIDEVTAALRGKLGEAMAAIERDSAPLPQVTTQSLDALRAYALGLDAYGELEFKSALQHFLRAIDLDPEFALAYMGAMRVFVSNADTAQAHAYLEKARLLRDRVPPRDALYLDAWKAELGPQPSVQAPPKWMLLSESYPDYFAGYHQYAWGQFLSGQYSAAVDAIEPAIVAQNPLRHVSINLRGRIELAQNKYAAALSSLQRAAALGGYPLGRRAAAALAAMSRFEEAEKLLASSSSGGLEEANLLEHFERIAIALDQGHLDEAEILVSLAVDEAATADALLRYPFRINELMVQGLQRPDEVSSQELKTLGREIVDDARSPSNADRDDLLAMGLAVVMLSQRLGHGEVANDILPMLEPEVRASGNPAATKLLALAHAEQLRLSDKPIEAVEKLLNLSDGSEPFQVHVALRESLQAAGRFDEAALESHWIAAHRGLAYSEPIGGQVFQAMNVVDTKLTHLATAELWAAAGQPEEARREADAFRRVWPEADLSPYFRRRLAATLSASKQ
ncbi:MAG TPA: putative peptide modification system cyclase [Lysobacter sp.]|nr:putative peptide modification system cyclase [Lysobacter sp.]